MTSTEPEHARQAQFFFCPYLLSLITYPISSIPISAIMLLMKVALVYDYLREFGGGERVLLALHEIYPEAPVYVSFADDKFLTRHPELKKLDIRTSPMQKIPLITKLSKLFSFAAPLLYERFDLSEYDVVISFGASWSKGVKTTKK